MRIERERFLKARDFLQTRREDYESACYGFEWPDIEDFSWALDSFDACAEGSHRTALWSVDEDGGQWKASFVEMKVRSSRVASFLRRPGLSRGVRVLVSLDNQHELRETMRAAIRIGAVPIPSSLLLTRNDIQGRIKRGRVTLVVTTPENAAAFEGLEGSFHRSVVGGATAGPGSTRPASRW